MKKKMNKRKRTTNTFSSVVTYPSPSPPSPWLHVSTNVRQILHTTFLCGQEKKIIYYQENQDTAQCKNKSEYYTHFKISIILFMDLMLHAAMNVFPCRSTLKRNFEKTMSKKRWDSEGGLLLKRWSFHRFKSHYNIICVCVWVCTVCNVC